MGERRSVVQIEVARDQAELAADALWRAAPSAVLEVDLAGDRVRLTADVADPGLVDPTWSATIVAVDDDAYLDAWRTYAAPVRAGHRVVLHPAWVELGEAAPDDVVVVLDPGRAFGSGSHESTRLAVGLLEAHLQPGDLVLDVGCGSGVLSVVACLLGAAAATAVDVDPQAVEATEANAAANGVADRITASAVPLAEVPGTFDLVVANIGGTTLWDLAPDLATHLRRGGRLVLSGILEDKVDSLAAVLPGCAEVTRIVEDGWAGWVGQALENGRTSTTSVGRRGR